LISSAGLATPHAEECASALGIPKTLAPGSDIFSEGLNSFIQKYEFMLLETNLSWETRIQKLGRRLYAEQTEEAPSASDEEDIEDQPIGESGEREWSPERVVMALEFVMIHAAQLLRRGRWLCMLSESSVAWESVNDDRVGFRALIIEGGSIVDRCNLDHHDEIPIPPGYGRDPKERRQYFNIATYDRMRVLNSEMKRLSTEKRSIYLRLNPVVILNENNLAKAFRWL
jgi:hypothetical protein